jgi:hypothetical protein
MLNTLLAVALQATAAIKERYKDSYLSVSGLY